MTNKNNDHLNEHSEIEHYGDPGISSADAPIATWLKWSYVLLPIWGIVWFFLFWNGSTVGWFDRGYWFQLQKAANTTFPSININDEEPSVMNNNSR